MKYKVIIDARIVTGNLTGIGRYTYEIIKKGSTLGVEYIALVNDEIYAKKIFNNIDNIQFIKLKSKFLNPLELIEIPIAINKYKNNNVIFHTPSFVASPFVKLKMIMTIHDLNHIKFPQFYSRIHKYYYKFIVKKCANKSKKILTVSEFSKKELIEWLGCKSNKISVTYNGIDEKFIEIKNEEELKKIQKKYNLPKKFILYVGNCKEHKNVEVLIKAIKNIDNYYLVISGNGTNELKKLARTLNVEDKVLFIGFINDNDLPALYSIAEAFIYPSLYEGFGLPILEAMACNCRTIVSDIDVFREITNNKCEYFNPKNSKELVEIMNNNKYIKHQDLKSPIKKFNWTKTAQKTVDVYMNIIKGD